MLCSRHMAAESASGRGNGRERRCSNAGCGTRRAWRFHAGLAVSARRGMTRPRARRPGTGGRGVGRAGSRPSDLRFASVDSRKNSERGHCPRLTWENCLRCDGRLAPVRGICRGGTSSRAWGQSHGYAPYALGRRSRQGSGRSLGGRTLAALGPGAAPWGSRDSGWGHGNEEGSQQASQGL